jgi:hypothetical protein
MVIRSLPKVLMLSLPSRPNGRRSKRVAGFSVLEAVIVLAITGMALTIVFSIGSRASEMGFRLGRSVLAVGDNEIARESFHNLVGGLIVPSTVDAAAGVTYAPPSLRGDALHFQAGEIAGRSTPCSSQGPSGLIEFFLVGGPQAELQCQVAGGAKVRLMAFKDHPAKFSYSLDGLNWTETVQIDPGLVKTADLNARPLTGFGRTLFIKVASDDGSVLIVERASTGRPVPHPVNQSDL